MGLFDAIFGNSPRRARRTTKRLNRKTRLNVNQRSASLTVGGKRTRVTAGRKGVRATIFGIRL